MNVPLNDAIGLRIYRELMHRESNCSATWQLNFGKEALSKAPPPETMINLGKFSKFSAVPMPLAMQLEAIKKEGRVQAAEVDRYEKRVYPSKSDLPISELSIKYYGDAAFHSKPKTSPGAPSTYEPYAPPPPQWTKRQWDVDRIQYVREGLGPAHVTARKLAGA